MVNPQKYLLIHKVLMLKLDARLGRRSRKNSLFFRGKSGLLRATPGVMPLHRKVRNSGTERMSKSVILVSGTGEIKGDVGVKTAKLGVKQDQIGNHYKSCSLVDSG